MSHECPIRGCATSVGDHKLMCVAHWSLVPQALQHRVYVAYNNGHGKGTPAHRDAMRAAIEALEGPSEPPFALPEGEL